MPLLLPFVLYDKKEVKGKLIMDRRKKLRLEKFSSKILNIHSFCRDNSSFGSPSSSTLPPSGVTGGKPSLPPHPGLEDPEMTSSTIETLNTMKTETIGHFFQSFF